MTEERTTQAGRLRPAYNANTLVNQLFAKTTKVTIAEGVAEEFPDVSFYQAVIDWNLMSAHTRSIIIRAGQRNWVDEKFKTNWVEAKRRKLYRGVYWLYDGRESPGFQANLLKSLIEHDIPEMEIWVDWEINYKGSYEGLKNVVAMMQALEAMFPGKEVGLYLGYYWMIANSNVLLNYSQYQYLKTRPLWLGQYTPSPITNLLIPAPFSLSNLRHHQYGTPVRGKEFGCSGSYEIDMNRYADQQKTYAERYNVTTPPIVISNGGTMAGTPITPLWMEVTATKLNVRSSAGGTVPETDLGDLYLHSKVLVDQTYMLGTITWYRAVKAYSPDGKQVLLADKTPLEGHTNCWLSGTYLTPSSAPVPIPDPTPAPIPTADELHIDVSIVGGKITGSLEGVAQGKPFTITY